MAKEPIHFQMEIPTLANTLMVNQMEKENIFGVLVKIMLEILLKEKNMERENGKAIKILTIQIYMMVNIWMIKSMERVYSHGQVEIYTKEIIKMMNVMEMGRCYGQMEVCTKENGKMEFSTDLEEWCLLMEQARRDILKITYSNIPYLQMNRIFKALINKVLAFSNKQSKYKWDQPKQAQIFKGIQKLTVTLIKLIK